MLSGLLIKLRSKAAILGAGLLAILAFFLRLNFLKNARDRAEIESDTLRATVHAERTRKKIIKEEEKERVSRRDTIKKELEKKGEEFEGVDNLTNSNDY
jgi:uncharacterized protein (DUF3084 family)